MTAEGTAAPLELPELATPSPEELPAVPDDVPDVDASGPDVSSAPFDAELEPHAEMAAITARGAIMDSEVRIVDILRGVR